MHIVLTRFNLHLAGLHRNGLRVAEDQIASWPAERAAIFEAICFPSVVAQSRRPDAWLIGFDALRRDEVETVLEQLKPYPWIEPVWQEQSNGTHEHWLQPFVRAIRTLAGDGCEQIITTRLDNDDAIAEEFCEQVCLGAEKWIQEKPDAMDFWLTFPTGIQLANGLVRPCVGESNAFLSRAVVIEGRLFDERHCAHGGAHSRILKSSPYVAIADPRPMWLQFVHRTNLSNRERRAAPLADPEAVLRGFSLPAQVLELSRSWYDSEKLARRPWNQIAKSMHELGLWLQALGDKR